MAVYGNTPGAESVGLEAGEVENGSESVVMDDLPAALAEEVRTGLQQTPKRVSSRFFYDAEGSRLFAEIMHLPEYYLTRSEYEILDTQKADLLHLFAPDGRPFELVELGAGDGLKTKLLLDFFTDQRIDFIYAPVDISADALDGLVTDLHRQWPDLRINPRHEDYF